MTLKFMANLGRRSLLLASSCLFVFLFAGLGIVVPLWGVSSSVTSQQLLSQVILDRHNRPLQIRLNSREEKSLALGLEEISDAMKYAFILSEDQRFFEHDGVDLKAIARAIFQSIKNLKIVSGASTITMQLSRIHWPHLARPQYKMAQMVQALRLERAHSKFEILQFYLNSVPFAKQVSGVSQACHYFFGKECALLSMAQVVSLAVLPRNPKYYLGDLQALRKKRNQLIKKVRHRLGQDQVLIQQALIEPISFQITPRESHALHFIHQLKKVKKRSDQKIVRTTLDLHLQKSIQKLLKENINKNGKMGDAGAILVVDNASGGVIAYVGSADYFDDKHGKLDTTQTLRSPGSALKPFVYAYALEMGWRLSSMTPDVPLKFKVSQGVFSPDNYSGSFSGPQQLRFSLANSKNIPALYLTAQLGEASVLSFLKRMGFASLKEDASHYGVGLSLGNGEVSLWELVRGYVALARGGSLIPLRLTKKEGRVLAQRVLSKETAFLITHVLNDSGSRAEEFGRDGPLEFNFPVAVKTGTSSDFRDHWTVGYSPKYTVGLWKGNANGSALKQQLPASKNTGPLFNEIIKLLHRSKEDLYFLTPKNITEEKVCSLSGQLVGPYCGSTRKELFYSMNKPHENCSVHKSRQVQNCNGSKKRINYVELPDEYVAWVEANNIQTLEKAINSECQQLPKPDTERTVLSQLPVIVEPPSGTLLAVDPTIPSSHQKLRLLVRASKKYPHLSLMVNGRLFKKMNQKNYISWPLKKGKYQFQLKDGQKLLPGSTEITVL